MTHLFQKNRLIILFVSLLFIVSSCSKDANSSNNSNGNGSDLAFIKEQIAILPAEPLNSIELSSLVYMREEEKLARDVYISLYNKWGNSIFNNIAQSEQSHMDGIMLLLNKYQLTDPAGSNGMGIFSNATLQNLYTTLVAKGTNSLFDAYIVGATIEDLDIFDLNNSLVSVDNKDIYLVYNNLTKGSRNHMRSFYKNILNLGGSYTPQYITRAEFDLIINSEMETGY